MSSLHVIASFAMVALVMLGGCTESKSASAIQFDNSYYYGPDGKFQEEKAKDAYIALMKYHGYPVYPGIREKLWVSDYNTGQFTKLGLGAIGWVNNEKDLYMLQDLYLMPGQMLPEHWHLDGEKGKPAKMEGWFIRHGLSHVVGEGENNLPKEVVIPKCHCNGTATVMHDVVATPGMFVPLNKMYAHHWQFAGPEGAIITEVGNLHTNSAVRHQDAAINKAFLGE